MTNLIDRAALLEQLETFREDKEWRSQRTIWERWLRTVGIDIFAEAVKRFPPVDAVEVIRCKDCKHYQFGEIFTDIKFCCRLKDRHGKVHRYNYTDDDFCSYGERVEA